MSVVRVYQLTSRPAGHAVLREAVAGLAGKVAGQPGCDGVDLVDPVDRPDVVVMIEYWRDDAARLLAGAALGREAFAGVMALSAGVGQTAGTLYPAAAGGRWWARPFRIEPADEGATR